MTPTDTRPPLTIPPNLPGPLRVLWRELEKQGLDLRDPIPSETKLALAETLNFGNGTVLGHLAELRRRVGVVVPARRVAQEERNEQADAWAASILRETAPAEDEMEALEASKEPWPWQEPEGLTDTQRDVFRAFQERGWRLDEPLWKERAEEIGAAVGCPGKSVSAHLSVIRKALGIEAPGPHKMPPDEERAEADGLRAEVERLIEEKAQLVAEMSRRDLTAQVALREQAAEIERLQRAAAERPEEPPASAILAEVREVMECLGGFMAETGSGLVAEINTLEEQLEKAREETKAKEKENRWLDQEIDRMSAELEAAGLHGAAIMLPFPEESEALALALGKPLDTSEMEHFDRLATLKMACRALEAVMVWKPQWRVFIVPPEVAKGIKPHPKYQPVEDAAPGSPESNDPTP